MIKFSLKNKKNMRKVCKKRGKVLKDWKIELFRYRNRSKNKKLGHINCKNKEMHL